MASLTAIWTSQAPFYEYQLTGTSYSTSGITADTTITIGGLVDGETYTFWVRGICENNLYSPWSNMSGVTCSGGTTYCDLAGNAVYIPPIVLFGKSYNWYAANYNTGGASIAPAGWHLSTNAEWNALFAVYGSTVPLKSKGTVATNPIGLWLDPDSPPNPAMRGTNASGFNIPPGGIVQWNGTYGADKTYADFWTEQTKAISITYPLSHPLYPGTYHPGSYKNFGYNGSNMYESSNDYIKQMGFSIRLVKDNTIGYTLGSEGTMTDIDGNIYPTKMMPDGKVWMTQNLRVSKYNNGVTIPVYALDTQSSRNAWRDTTLGGIGNYH